jgi:hypothetical protein
MRRIKKPKFKLSFWCLLELALIAFLVSCQNSPNLIGRWQEIGKSATFEFHEDSTFNAIDNMGMAVSGKYFLDGSGNIRFEIMHDEPSPEVIKAKVLVRDDELIFIYGDNGEAENYGRVKQ